MNEIQEAVIGHIKSQEDTVTCKVLIRASKKTHNEE